MGNKVGQLNKRMRFINNNSESAEGQKFFVQMECITHKTIEISAESIENAIEKAKEAKMDKLFEECVPVYAISKDGKEEWKI